MKGYGGEGKGREEAAGVGVGEWGMLGGCPYCPAGQERRSSRTAGGRWVRECGGCCRVVEELASASHDLFYLRAQDSPLCIVTPDLIFDFPSFSSSSKSNHVPDPDPSAHGGGGGGDDDDDDPFESPGFITAFSTWSLESVPTPSLSSFSFSGLLAQLERSLLLDSTPASSSSSVAAGLPTSPAFPVDNLRARLQIMEVGSLLKLDWDILDHSFQLFRDCSSVTCLRNRNVEALATAALLHAIREAQEPRTLQEISTAANLPQKEIGKYIKILGEALKLSQPINSNSISVHMPRFCKLLQLNPIARDIATHIGEVVVNKCFCTRRNPISISAAAIYLACQLEDKRKTQAEICKVTGLTEVTLRKVYKELLENWDDLLPPNYTPAVPPEKAFPMTCIPFSGRSLTPKLEFTEIPSSATVQEVRDKQIEINNPHDASKASQMDCSVQQREKSIMDCNPGKVGANHDLSIQIAEVCGGPSSSHFPFFKPDIKNENIDWQIDINQTLLDIIDLDEGSNRDENIQTSKLHSGPSSSTVGSTFWPLSGDHDHILQRELGLNSSSEPPWNRSSSKCEFSRNRDDFKDNEGPGNFR